MALLRTRVKNAWNAFMNKDPTTKMQSVGYGVSMPSHSRNRRYYGTDLQSTLTVVFNKIAVDCSSMRINHVRLDEEGRYKETIMSGLNRCLSKQANIDQIGRVLIQDSVMEMLENGCVAIVPVKTSDDPSTTDSYDVYELRKGTILEWFPAHVLVEVYNERNGEKEQLKVEKRYTTIIENPFYDIMNAPNSTGRRLMRVLNQLEHSNEHNSSGKLDLIIQLPYTIRSDARRKQADERRESIESQLSGSSHGIAYTDASEKIIQLNRSLDNNLWEQAKELKQELFNELGFTQSILDGTADEQTMLNYNNRIVDPILSVFVNSMEVKWLSLTAQSQGQAIRYFKDPFKLVTVERFAEISDKLTRNEICTSNEIRSVIGMKPVDDPRADELRNSNLNHPDEKVQTTSDDIDISKLLPMKDQE